MTRKIAKDKFLIIDTDSAVYACCFITQKKEHFGLIKGKMMFASKDKRKYNKWFKELDSITAATVDYDFTEELLPFSEAKKAMDGWIKDLMYLSGCKRKVLMLTKGGSCFRTYLATLKKYKGNRDNLVRPVYYDKMREYLIGTLKAKVYAKWEADDTACMSMAKAEGNDDVMAILAAIDKDLEQQRGRHVNPNKKAEGVYTISDFEGWYSFYKQMLMGDTADNIPGLFKVGEKKAITMLEDCTTVKQLCQKVWDMYIKHGGDHVTYAPWWWLEKYDDAEYHDHALVEELRAKHPDKTRKVPIQTVFRENADLLYMLRTPTDQYTPHIKFEDWTPYPKGTVIQYLGDK